MVAMNTQDVNAFRFYGTGTESGSSQLAAQDTNHTLTVSGDTSFQVRYRVDETGGVDGSTMDDYQLEYEKNDGGTWVALTTTDNGDGIRAVAAGLTGGSDTTNRSTDPISDPGGGSFVAGEQSSTGDVSDRQITANNFTEHVYGVEIVDANVANNDTFDFRLTGSGVDTDNTAARITVSKSADVDIDAGTATITLTGETASIASADNVDANTASVTLTGQTASLTHNVDISAGTASVSLTGETASLTHNVDISANTASITLTGQTASIDYGTNIEANAASVTLTGETATVSSADNVDANAASIALTGETATVSSADNVNANAASIALTGETATISSADNVNANAATIALTGETATITYTATADTKPDGAAGYHGTVTSSTTDDEEVEAIVKAFLDFVA